MIAIPNVVGGIFQIVWVANVGGPQSPLLPPARMMTWHRTPTSLLQNPAGLISLKPTGSHPLSTACIPSSGHPKALTLWLKSAFPAPSPTFSLVYKHRPCSPICPTASPLQACASPPRLRVECAAFHNLPCLFFMKPFLTPQVEVSSPLTPRTDGFYFPTALTAVCLK